MFETLGVLHIVSISRSDEALYSCVATSEGRVRISDAATLTVNTHDLGKARFPLPELTARVNGPS